MRRVGYRSLYQFDKLTKSNSGVYVLCYHSFADDSWRYSVSLKRLREQIAFLKKEGYKFVTLDDINDYINKKKSLPSKSIAITVDDGYQDVLKAVGLFKREKFLPTLFMVSEPQNVNRQELNSNKKLLSTTELRYLQSQGWEIGVHSATHSDLVKTSIKNLHTEIVTAKKKLEKVLGRKVKYFAYPFGSYNNNVLKKVSEGGYRMAVSMDDRMVLPGIDTLTVPRLEVNNTYSLSEFKTIFSPSVISVRRNIRRLIGL